MSVDSTLKLRNSLQRHRNVLTRAERIALLKDTDRWTDESTALGLPKVIHRKAAVGKKTKEKKSEGEGEGEGEGDGEGDTTTTEKT